MRHTMVAGEARHPSGVVTPLVTPLTSAERLDHDTLSRLVEHQIEAGVDGVFPLGSVGEGPLLPEPVRTEVLRVCLDAAGGRVPVYAGAMDNATTLVLRRLEALAEVGADAGAVTLPYYGWPDDPEAATSFFLTLADRSPVPLILYNLPKVSGVSLSPDTLRALYHHPRITALKDTREDLASMEAIASDPQRASALTYLPGNSRLAAHLLAVGADGLISVLGNVAPDLVVALYRAHQGGDVARRDACAEIMRDLSMVVTRPTAAGSVKCALEILGFGNGRTVHPWPGAGTTDRAFIARTLAEAASRMEALNVTLIGRRAP